MKKNDLNSVWENFNTDRTEENRKKLVQASAIHIFSNLNYIASAPCSLKEDTKSEFILWIYPKLDELVEKFNPEKASFLTYINMITKFKYKTFRMEQKKRYEIQEAAESEEKRLMDKVFMEENTGSLSSRREAMEAADFSPNYRRKSLCRSFQGAAITNQMRKRKARDILLLALKSTFYISEDMIEKTAALCGMGKEELRNLLETVRSDYGEKQKLFESMKMQRHEYYLRAFICQQRLDKLAGECNTETWTKEPIEKEKEFCERQKERLRIKMKKIQRTPSNRYLASLLNIPRGSVDSALVRLKKQLYSDKPWISM